MFHSIAKAPNLAPVPNFRPNTGQKQVKTCAYGNLQQAGLPSVTIEVTEKLVMHINCHVQGQPHNT